MLASETPVSQPAPPGSTTTETATWICSLPTTSSGRKRPTCSARLLATQSRTAHPSHIRARVRRCIGTAGTKRLRMSPQRRVSVFRPQRDSESRCWTSTVTPGSTSSSPTTPNPTNSFATVATVRSRTSVCWPAWPSAKRAWRGRGWGSMRPTMTPLAGRVWSLATFQPRCWGSITTRVAVCSSTKHLGLRLAAPRCRP